MRPARLASDAAQQLDRRDLEGAGDADHGRELGVALAAFEAADLAAVHLRPLGELAHRERPAVALVGQVGAEAVGDRSRHRYAYSLCAGFSFLPVAAAVDSASAVCLTWIYAVHLLAADPLPIPRKDP